MILAHRPRIVEQAIFQEHGLGKADHDLVDFEASKMASTFSSDASGRHLSKSDWLASIKQGVEQAKEFEEEGNPLFRVENVYVFHGPRASQATLVKFNPRFITTVREVAYSTAISTIENHSIKHRISQRSERSLQAQSSTNDKFNVSDQG